MICVYCNYKTGWCPDIMDSIDGEHSVTVMTKIDDRNGVRNELMTLTGSLWFSGGMYVYYEPTHWKNI